MRGAAREWAALGTCALLLVVGVALLVREVPTAADACFLAAAGVGLLLCSVSLWHALRARRPSVDVLAVLALVGAVVVTEYLAAAVVAVMLATGQLLEARAQARAARELTLLVDRAPRTARVRRDGEVAVVDADHVLVGDVLVVGPGEITPVDGRLLSQTRDYGLVSRPRT